MVREYITGPVPHHPVRFAEQYYQHYPKVALGHWPPVFYIIQAIWMILFTGLRISVRAEIAFTTAALAFSVWSEARRWFDNHSAKWAPMLAGVLLICLPLVQNATDQEMAEALLTLFCFWSTVYFGRYLASEKTSDILWFALYFSLAVLTKGSGWMLAILPPLALLLTRKLRLLLRPSFWLGPLLIAVLCLPWQVVTIKSAARGWTGGTTPSFAYTGMALVRFALIVIDMVGLVLSILMFLGIFVTVLLPFVRRPVRYVPAVMFGLIVSDWLFHSLVPAGVEDRKMILAVPAVIYFVFTGASWLADRIRLGEKLQPWRRSIVGGIAGLSFAATVFAVPHIKHYGYDEAARYLLANGDAHLGTILISSESGGEGWLISELAMRDPRPKMVVLRATKELAVVDWNGRQYRSLFSTPNQLLAYTDRRGIRLLVLDDYPAQLPFSHQRLIQQTIASYPNRFHLLKSFSEPSAAKGEIDIYQVVPPK
jgi:hypothetical protein